MFTHCSSLSALQLPSRHVSAVASAIFGALRQPINLCVHVQQMSIAEDDVASADAGRLDTLHHQNVQLKDDLRQCLMTQFCSTKQQMEQAESTLCNHQVHASRPELY